MGLATRNEGGDNIKMKNINFDIAELIKTDLENRGAIVTLIAEVNPSNHEVDYTIKAKFPKGRTWLIIDIAVIPNY